MSHPAAVTRLVRCIKVKLGWIGHSDPSWQTLSWASTLNLVNITSWLPACTEWPIMPLTLRVLSAWNNSSSSKHNLTRMITWEVVFSRPNSALSMSLLFSLMLWDSPLKVTLSVVKPGWLQQWPGSGPELAAHVHLREISRKYILRTADTLHPSPGLLLFMTQLNYLKLSSEKGESTWRAGKRPEQRFGTVIPIKEERGKRGKEYRHSFRKVV